MSYLVYFFFFVLFSDCFEFDDIFDYINCHDCGSVKSHSVRDVNNVGLYIVSESCISDNSVKLLYNIGGTNKYYVIFTINNINDFCKDYMEYIPKMKISQSLYSTQSQEIIVSYISNDINTNQSIITQLLQKQLDDTNNIVIQENIVNDYYFLVNRANSYIIANLNDTAEMNYNLIYIRLTCPSEIIKCGEYLSYNKYILDISIMNKYNYLSEPKDNIRSKILNNFPVNDAISLKNKYGHSYIQHPDGSNVIWDQGLTGNNTILGCADSGLDVYHCMFYDNERVSYDTEAVNRNHRKILKYNNFIDKTDNANGHGTHVVGTMVGRNSGSNHDYDGISYDAKIVFDDLGNSSNPRNIYTPKDVGATLFSPSQKLGVRIHSNSWGSTTNAYETLTNQVDTFIYKNPYFLPIFANGNDGPSDNTVGAPATCKNCLSVGATINADFYSTTPNKNFPLYLAYFSSRGYTSDYRIKPDIVAPGHGIFSAAASGKSQFTNECKIFKNSGTSMATPLVSGAVNLIYQYLTEGFYPTGSRNANNSLSQPLASLLKAMAIHSGRKLKGYEDLNEKLVDDRSYPSIRHGFGLMTLSNVLKFQSSDFNLFLKSIEITTSLNYHIYTLKIVNPSKGIKATLVWTDPPVTQSSTRALVHNLDLRLIINNVVYFSNGLEGIDLRNNVEQIWLDSLPSGTDEVRITIHAQLLSSNIPKQEYSLVITGDFINDNTNIRESHEYISDIDPGIIKDDFSKKKDSGFPIYYYYAMAGACFIVLVCIIYAIGHFSNKYCIKSKRAAISNAIRVPGNQYDDFTQSNYISQQMFDINRNNMYQPNNINFQNTHKF